MAYKVKLSEFEGPLDLLLEIVEAKKFNVLTISLSQLAEEFLNYLKALPEKNIYEITQFIAVAARLALLKSRELVPSLLTGDQDGEENLKNQLALYHPYRAAAKKLERISRSKKKFYSREAFYAHPPVFSFPNGLSVDILTQNIKNALGSIDHARHIPQAKVTETLSLEESIEHLRKVIKGEISFNFTSFLKEKKSEDHVVHFIGLLELVRCGQVEAKQKVAFGTIEISVHAK